MAKQTINLGATPTGAGGDTTRSAFNKMQSNVDELYLRTNSLGTAANRNAGSAYGQVQLVGDRPAAIATSINMWGNSFAFWNNISTVGAPEVQSGTMLNMAWPDGNYGAQILASFSGNLFFRAGDYTSAPMRKVWHSGNTTVGSGGVLSQASPILRVASIDNTERQDLVEEGFEIAGLWGAVNLEAKGVQVERLAVGTYRVTGSLGLALQGWRIQDPCSPDGGRTLGLTEASQDENGVITILLFKQRWSLTDDGEMVLGKGNPIDVPVNSWIDVRLEMPKLEEPPVPVPVPTETVTEE
ncbi:MULTISPECIES: hypothetical protein [unclassified Pseudomonas]|uniref:phage tail fiber protein n=1 Tax=unclassified Pseudomonas TaxID=196821 RepID=UPI0011A7EEF6|nr:MULTISPECIES: hypothetical protein [unclassified Pseudomonas]TWC27730.1 hypothetical protein FBY05_101595 [Pseudomonas sp. SJZ083]TWC53930.1 hypothetical protein FBY01_101121 [Pseudomonas sp. SJZ077]